MKTKKIISALMLVLSATAVNAQLKVTTATGKVKVGLEPPVGVGTDDPYNVLAMHVYGPNGDVRAAGKIAIGDFGRYDYYGWNVFVGEYRDYDSDQLWLHGKNGIYLTRGRGDDIIGYYDVSAGNKFTFNCDVYGSGYYIASDARFKTNVKKLDNALDKVMKLDAVSYNLLPKVISEANNKTAGISGAAQAAADKTMTAPTAKELKAKAEGEALAQKQQEIGPKRLGFIAQDVKKVFPDLVKQDSTSNYMYVDYVGLIPVLAEAIKEQQQQLQAKDDQIKALESRLASVEDVVNSCCSNKSTGTSSTTKDGVSSFLYQNEPNPFTSKTDIRYFLTEDVQSAAINVYDMQGNMMKSFKLQGHGQGSVTVSGSELKAGIYLYTLTINGKEADVKRMSLVN